VKIISLFKLETISDDRPAISLPEPVLHQIADQQAVNVRCGSVHLELGLSETALAGTIGLSASVRQELGMPNGISLQIEAGPQGVYLGPVVGLIGGREPEDLTEARLGALKNHMLAYEEHGGLFVCTTPGSIDADRQRVSGYVYSPSGTGTWIKETCPLPRVFFRRYGVNVNPLRPQFRKAGVRVVNERIFDKSEAALWMAADEKVAVHLPETLPFKGLPALLDMLDRHGSVFVKPVWGSLARSIVRLEKVSDQIKAQTPSDEVQIVAPSDLADHLPKGSSIIQQALDLVRVGDRLIDFRVITQRDGRGKWIVSGVYGRCGESGLIVSNMSTGGFPLSATDGLSLLFGDSPQVIFRRLQELVRLGLSVGRSLEYSGLLLGDLGIDVAYDKRGFPWIIEANNRDPDHNIAWEANDWSTFYSVRTRPVRFCIWLDGFVGEGG